MLINKLTMERTRLDGAAAARKEQAATADKTMKHASLALAQLRKEMQQSFENSTARLLIAAQSHDMVSIREAHDLVVKSCRACHDKFHRN